jgi:hypothetical protein
VAFFLENTNMSHDKIVPIHRRSTDGRRILSDGRVLDLTQYARQPNQRTVALILPISMVERIDALARRDLLSRSSWLRSRIARAVEHEREQATA